MTASWSESRWTRICSRFRSYIVPFSTMYLSAILMAISQWMSELNVTRIPQLVKDKMTFMAILVNVYRREKLLFEFPSVCISRTESVLTSRFYVYSYEEYDQHINYHVEYSGKKSLFWKIYSTTHPTSTHNIAIDFVELLQLLHITVFKFLGSRYLYNTYKMAVISSFRILRGVHAWHTKVHS